MKKSPMRLICLAAFLAAVCGCGTGQVKTAGTVTFSDGTPVDGGYVFFLKGSESGRGTIQPNGSFQAGWLSDDEGLPPGQYRVYLQGPFVVTTADPEDPGVSTIDPKFQSPDTSGITVDIEKGKFVPMSIVVERNPAAKGGTKRIE